MKYKKLFRLLEQHLDRVEPYPDTPATLAAIVRRLVDDLQDDLGIVGGRVYVRRGQDYVLQSEYPEQVAPRGFRIPLSYGPVQELLRHGVVFHLPGDPGVDARVEGALGVAIFAAVCIGEHCRQIIAFSVREGSEPEHVVSILNTVRHVVNLRLRKDHLEDSVAQVRSIQLSLLPANAPVFADYDVWARMRPAEDVGGDLYDYIQVSPRSLGLAVADSAGHGLPAALQARDVIIGLRMSVEEELRITATVEKLNRVINRSALSSKFISLFYGELDTNGVLVFCNAGHVPPLLWHGDHFEELTVGGMVLGPNPSARYQRGYTRLEPGSILLAYTDGISEEPNGGTDRFEIERLREIVTSKKWRSARSLVDAVFDAVDRFSSAASPTDDQTVLAVVRR